MGIVIIEEGETSKMPQKLETVLKKVEEISNDVNRQLTSAILNNNNDYFKIIIHQNINGKPTRGIPNLREIIPQMSFTNEFNNFPYNATMDSLSMFEISM